MLDQKRKAYTEAMEKSYSEMRVFGEASETTRTKEAEAQTAFLTAESDLQKALQKTAQDKQSADEAMLNEYNEAIRLNEQQMSSLENNKTINEALGIERDAFDIQADLRVSKKSLELTREQMASLSPESFYGSGETEEERAADRQKQYDNMMAMLEEAETQQNAKVIELE